MNCRLRSYRHSNPERMRGLGRLFVRRVRRVTTISTGVLAITLTVKSFRARRGGVVIGRASRWRCFNRIDDGRESYDSVRLQMGAACYSICLGG
jgi:hypothetical protein